MSYIIIAFVLLLVIAPIIKVLPSRADREKMNLRREAMRQGVHVEITKIDDPIPKQDKYITHTGRRLDPILNVTAYHLFRKKPAEWRQERTLSWSIERRVTPSTTGLPGNWEWIEKPVGLAPGLAESVASTLPLLPDDAVKVSETNYRVSVYWHERSGQSGLAGVMQFLGETVHQPLVVAADLPAPD